VGALIGALIGAPATKIAKGVSCLVIMSGVVTVLEYLPPLAVLVVAVVLVAGETGVIVGLFFPVEITLMFVGFLTYLGDLPFAPVLLLMLAAAMTGDALALRSGRRHGPRVRASRFGRWIGDHRWDRADRVLHRLGGRSAFVARWVPFVRTLLPRLAGSAGMPYRRFLPWNVVGVVTAVGSSVVVGYLAGASFARAAEALGRATGAVAILLALIVAIILVGNWLGRHPAPVRALGTRSAALPPLRWLARRHGELFRTVAARVGAGWTLVFDLAAGLVLLFGIGLGLSWLVRLTVAQSGLSRVDAAIAGWIAEQRTEAAAGAAEVATRVLGGTVLVVVVAIVALGLGAVRRVWRRDLVGIAGTAGAFVPLLVLAVAADVAGGDPTARPASPMGMFSTQSAVATAALCTLAWLLTRQARWPLAVAAWTGAAVGVVLVISARLYLGWNTASETATAVLLGAMWPALFMIAWAARDRAGSGRHLAETAVDSAGAAIDRGPPRAGDFDSRTAGG
jgi:membrane protein DedA with SNARE-associated domain